MFKSLFKNKGEKLEQHKEETSTVSAVITEGENGEINVNLSVNGNAAHFLEAAAALIVNVTLNTDIPEEMALFYVIETVSRRKEMKIADSEDADIK